MNEEVSEGCQCEECQVVTHKSDCAVHNEPAYPKGECNCGALNDNDKKTIKQIEWFQAYEKHHRNGVLEEVASMFDRMPFGDTAASFAIFVRGMKE